MWPLKVRCDGASYGYVIMDIASTLLLACTNISIRPFHHKLHLLLACFFLFYAILSSGAQYSFLAAMGLCCPFNASNLPWCPLPSLVLVGVSHTIPFSAARLPGWTLRSRLMTMVS